jgi:hypothetical protein
VIEIIVAYRAEIYNTYIKFSRKDGSTMKKDQKHSDESLKGTFVSVMLLGGFLLVAWVAVYVLFIARG